MASVNGCQTPGREEPSHDSQLPLLGLGPGPHAGDQQESIAGAGVGAEGRGRGGGSENAGGSTTRARHGQPIHRRAGISIPSGAQHENSPNKQPALRTYRLSSDSVRETQSFIESVVSCLV